VEFWSIDCFLDDNFDSNLFLALFLDSFVDKAKFAYSNLFLKNKMVERETLEFFGYAWIHLYTLLNFS